MVVVFVGVGGELKWKMEKGLGSGRGSEILIRSLLWAWMRCQVFAYGLGMMIWALLIWCRSEYGKTVIGYITT